MCTHKHDFSTFVRVLLFFAFFPIFIYQTIQRAHTHKTVYMANKYTIAFTHRLHLWITCVHLCLNSLGNSHFKCLHVVYTFHTEKHTKQNYQWIEWWWFCFDVVFGKYINKIMQFTLFWCDASISLLNNIPFDSRFQWVIEISRCSIFWLGAHVCWGSKRNDAHTYVV